MNLMGSILLSTEDSCEAHSPFQIYLFWMKIHESSSIKLAEKIQKSNPPLNVQIYILYLISEISKNSPQKAKANLKKAAK